MISRAGDTNQVQRLSNRTLIAPEFHDMTLFKRLLFVITWFALVKVSWRARSGSIAAGRIKTHCSVHEILSNL